MANQSLELRDALTGRVVGTSRSMDSGEFAFPGVANGLYLLNLKDGEAGEFAIGISPSAHADHLDLELAPGPCGSFFTDRSRCPDPVFRTSQFSGDVTDGSGGFIPGANVILRNNVGAVIEQIQTGESGEFALTRTLSAAATVEIEALGFTTLRGTVEPANRPQRFQVGLGVAGSCHKVSAIR
jgi:hypothetical protein